MRTTRGRSPKVKFPLPFNNNSDHNTVKRSPDFCLTFRTIDRRSSKYISPSVITVHSNGFLHEQADTALFKNGAIRRVDPQVVEIHRPIFRRAVGCIYNSLCAQFFEYFE
jgi:hypothetical protein